MVHVLVRHKVADYSRWKQAFDAHLTARLHAGETGFRVFRSVDDPAEVTLLLDWDGIEHARKFMNSDELKNAMQKAGVASPPEVHYVEDVQLVRRSSAD